MAYKPRKGVKMVASKAPVSARKSTKGASRRRARTGKATPVGRRRRRLSPSKQGK